MFFDEKYEALVCAMALIGAASEQLSDAGLVDDFDFDLTEIQNEINDARICALGGKREARPWYVSDLVPPSSEVLPERTP